MNLKEFKNDKTDSEPLSKLFEKDGMNAKGNTHNYFVYGDKNDFINEDIFFKEKEAFDINYIDNNKSNVDLNLSEKNLHEFLNDDLIKALDNDLMNPDDYCDKSDSSSSNPYISESSNYTSQTNSPEPNIKISKSDKPELNTNLNKENCIINNSKDANMNSDMGNGNDINNKEKNGNIKKGEREENMNNLENIKEKINILNDPLLAPMIIPIGDNNEIEKKPKEEKEHKKESKESLKEKRNNSLKNKFDDDVEPIMLLSMTNLEEKTKLPLEIRVGDWICLYCNNLNFSFRIKCNRCGLLRKSSTHLLKKRHYANKYQYIGNYSNYNDSQNTNFCTYNYDLNYNNNSSFTKMF